jgi:hypothetical protein
MMIFSLRGQASPEEAAKRGLFRGAFRENAYRELPALQGKYWILRSFNTIREKFLLKFFGGAPGTEKGGPRRSRTGKMGERQRHPC